MTGYRTVKKEIESLKFKNSFERLAVKKKEGDGGANGVGQSNHPGDDW